MSHEPAIRAAAVVAALAILAAPHWRTIVRWAAAAARAADAYRADASRAAVAAVIVAFAFGAIPLPSLQYAVPRIDVPTPSDAMQRTVAPVGAALRDATPADKAAWAAVWMKGAKVVAHNDPSDMEAKIKNTAELRSVLIVALDVGWRRIQGRRSGEYSGLREAVEGALTKAIGDDQKDLDAATAATAEDLFLGIAWAGLHGG